MDMSCGFINKPSIDNGWQCLSASLAGHSPGTTESTHPQPHCPSGCWKGATWAQPPMLLPRQNPPLQRLAVVVGITQPPTYTRSSHRCYCSHVLHQRPPDVSAADTLCPGDPMCWPHLCCTGDRETPPTPNSM